MVVLISFLGASLGLFSMNVDRFFLTMTRSPVVIYLFTIGLITIPSAKLFGRAGNPNLAGRAVTNDSTSISSNSFNVPYLMGSAYKNPCALKRGSTISYCKYPNSIISLVHLVHASTSRFKSLLMIHILTFTRDSNIESVKSNIGTIINIPLNVQAPSWLAF